MLTELDQAALFRRIFPARRTAPDPAAIRATAEAILGAKRPLVICGGPVIAGAAAELDALAERLDMPIATTISGKGSLSEDHPLAAGVVGSNGGMPETRVLVDRADLVVFVGCRAGSVTTKRRRHPAPREVRVVHVDVDPAVISANYRTEITVVADARLALAALADELAGLVGRPRGEGSGRSAVAAATSDKFAAFAELARSHEVPIRPERIVATLQALLPPDAVVVADAGTPCPYLSAYYRQRRAGRHFICNRAHGALGHALPAVIGAQIGRPDARCIAVMGDGSFGFASGELETVARLGLQADAPTLVDVVTQPLHEARAPVSEWAA